MAQLALGTVQFGLDYGISNKHGRIKWNELENMLDFAFANGITLLDTAAAYGNSESLIGRYFSGKKGPNFNTVTKIAECEKDDIEQCFTDSLKRLEYNSIYGLLFHNYKALSIDYSKWNVLEGLKRNGSVEKIGVSLYHPSEWIDLLTQNIVPDIVQIPVSIFDQRFIPYFSEMKEVGVEIHVRSVFLQGLYFVDADKLSDFFKPVKDSIIQLNAVSGSSGLSVESLCLNFVNSYKEIDYIIIGVDSLDQLKLNLSLLLENKQKFLEIENKLKRMKIEDERMVLPYLWPEK